MKIRISKKIVSIITMFALLLTVTALSATVVSADNESPILGNGTTYYVDSQSGSDSNNGTSSSTAWQTLSKINATTFQPGDNILFKKGGVWEGVLYPKGSGTYGSPITVSSYGSDTAMPLINGNGEYFVSGSRDDAAVYLYNQSYWTISGLDVTNFSTTLRDRYGIHVDGSSGSQAGIKIINCRVHDVSNDGNSGDHGRLSGISVWSRDWNTVFTDVVIENNEVYGIGSTGIYVNCLRSSGATTNTRVANNYLYNIGGDGILVVSCVSPVVEYNVVNESHNKSTAACVALWPFECTDALFQFNEAYNTKTIADGQGFDCDFMCTGTTFQYNYGHDNEGGFFLICTEPTNWDGSKVGFNEDVVVRYNIGQNNKARQFVLSSGILNTKIYNNTVYVPSNSNSTMFYVYSRNGVDWPTNTKVYNNIFYSLSSTAGYDMYGCTDTEWDYNVFYGSHPNNEPADAHKITADPKLFLPGGASVGMETCDAYVLKQGSPAIGAGKVIADNGGRDYFGNTVSATASPNIGAYNGAGVDSSFVMRTGSDRPTRTTSFSTAAPTQPSTAPIGTNLSLGKTATASASEGVNTADKAIDGGAYTRWSSGFTDNQWITIDLGTTYNVNQVRLKWETAYGSAYKIQTSLDNSTWTDQYSTTNGDGGYDDILFAPVSARYVRMLGIDRATTYGYSLYEFEIYSNDTVATTATTTTVATTVPTTTVPTTTSAPSGTTNIALNKTVTASAIRNNSLVERAVDGVKNNASQRLDLPTGTQWVVVDLGGTYSISQVKMYWEAWAKDYQIQTSRNGTDWTTVKTVTDNVQNGYPSVDTHDVSVSKANYVRIYMTSLYSQWGYGICEIEVYGQAVSTDPTNVALNKTVTASAIRNNSLVTRAVDGVKNNASQRLDLPTGTQWVVVDLQDTYTLSQVKMYWESWAKDYEVQVSSNGTDWTTVSTVTDNAQNGYPSVNTHNFTETDARYVRIYMTSLYSQWGYGICEIEVMGY